MPAGTGDQGLPGFGPHLGVQSGPLLLASRRAGSTPRGRRGRAALRAAGRASSPDQRRPPAGHTATVAPGGPPGGRPGWPPPPRAPRRWRRSPRPARTNRDRAPLASASAMAPLPVPASTTRVRLPRPRRRRRRASPSATSTTCSVSGRGIRTRESTHRSRPRKGQWPKMYCSGSPATRRAAMARAAAAAPAGTVRVARAGPCRERHHGHLVDDEAGLVTGAAQPGRQLVHKRACLDLAGVTSGGASGDERAKATPAAPAGAVTVRRLPRPRAGVPACRPSARR